MMTTRVSKLKESEIGCTAWQNFDDSFGRKMFPALWEKAAPALFSFREWVGGLQMVGVPLKSGLQMATKYTCHLFPKSQLLNSYPCHYPKPFSSLFPFMPLQNHSLCHDLAICTSVPPFISFFNFHPFSFPSFRARG